MTAKLCARSSTPDESADMIDESRAVAVASLFSAWASSAGVLGEREDSFLPVPVPPWFCPRLHPDVLSQLQTPPAAKRVTGRANGSGWRQPIGSG